MPKRMRRTKDTPFIVAIDGPSGVGKGTIARRVAGALGYRYVDTGAMYRAVAWLALARGTSLADEGALAELADQAAIHVAPEAVSVDGHDVTRAIRTPEIDKGAAAVARWPRVREILVKRQRALGASGGIVIEGRDIGTVVFPNADVKIYLDASPTERARRRASDQAHAHGANVPLDHIARELAERDESDRGRSASPLTIASDASVVDTTGLSIEDVFARVMAIVRAAVSP
jgi:cytidylate kinase